MEQTRKHFTHDSLLETVRKSFVLGLKRYGVEEVKRTHFSNVTCLMSGISLYTFKFASLLQFDQTARSNTTKANNLKTLFQLSAVPSDTLMRERLDVITPDVCRQAYTALFARLQRAHLLDHYKFMNKYFLVSLDGTEVFSSDKIHCSHCCERKKNKNKTQYYHQILAAALVHPDQKVVYPFAPESIKKEDGMEKNDCERNAAKRWIADFKREHPHLQTVIVADGLYANEPFINTLVENNMSYILVCKEGDHPYLFDWIRDLEEIDQTVKHADIKNGHRTYRIMRDVPLNSKENTKVTLVTLEETIKGKTTKWTWVTNLDVTLTNVEEFAKGARARWHIENQTFNTLKNQGYQFEHNFGHGNKYLHTVLTHLMMLAFFVDQCLQAVNKRFLKALSQYTAKYVLWERMRGALELVALPDFETLYHILYHPPPHIVISSVNEL